MLTLRVLAIALATLAFASGRPAVAGAAKGPGQLLLDRAFDPEWSFRGDLITDGHDQLILTVWASARDDYAPAYSLAIAYHCRPAEQPGLLQCGHTARMLRTGSTDQEMIAQSLALAGQAHSARSAPQMKRRLEQAPLQWLEADLDACPEGIIAMDSIRAADWRPDIHWGLLSSEDREVILHPAQIRIRMSGAYATSRYDGWVLAAGVPAAVRRLTQTLQPCWKPGASPRPWNRR